MKKLAVWGIDYDMHNDKCYDRPVCPECKAPFGMRKDGYFHCYSCGDIITVEDPTMLKWFEDRSGTKIEKMGCIV